jgi:hypothetical protein
MSLPNFFGVQFMNRYRIYTSKLARLSSDVEINVLSPEDKVEAGTLTIKLANDREKECTIRKWNENDNYKCLKWSFSGSFLQIKLQSGARTDCPILLLDDKSNLPYNSCVFYPTREVFADDDDDDDEFEHTTLQTPWICQDGSCPPMAMAAPRPMAMAAPRPVAMAAPRPMAMAAPAPRPVPLPAHVVNLILADAISKNEACSISSEPITRENAKITPCGHVFQRVSLDRWFATPASKGLCPVCKQKCL